jgi:hypothetical protein
MSRISDTGGWLPYTFDQIATMCYEKYKIQTGQVNLTFQEFVGTVGFELAEYTGRFLSDAQSFVALANNYLLMSIYDANEAILSQKNCVNGATQLNFKDVCLGMNYQQIVDASDSNKVKLEINIDTPLDDSGNSTTNFVSNCTNLKKSFAYSAHDLVPTKGDTSIAITDIDNNVVNVQFNYINSSILASSFAEKGYLAVDCYIQFVTRRPNDPVIVNAIESDFRAIFNDVQKIGIGLYSEAYIHPRDYNCIDFVISFRKSGSTDPWQTSPIEVGSATKCTLSAVTISPNPVP